MLRSRANFQERVFVFNVCAGANAAKIMAANVEVDCFLETKKQRFFFVGDEVMIFFLPFNIRMVIPKNSFTLQLLIGMFTRIILLRPSRLPEQC